MRCPNPAGAVLWAAGLWGFALLFRCAGPMYCTGSFRPVLAPIDTTLDGSPRDTHEYAVLRAHRTIGWEMNNILFSSTDKSLNKFKNMEESTIAVRAVLYDDALIAAELRADSSGVDFDTLLDAYRRRHHPDALLRITLHLESHFARRSLDPDKWTIYLVDENGDMYEPDSVRNDTIGEEQVERWERNQKYFRNRYRSELNLYFKKTTFYGQPVLGRERRSLRLVMAFNRTVIGEGTWCFVSGE